MTLPGAPGARPRPDPAASARVKDWATAVLHPGDECTVLVTELACTEPGCPPVETVIALLGRAEPTQWKLHKPVAAITENDVRTALGT